jgi:uncharacterized protein YkwD
MNSPGLLRTYTAIAALAFACVLAVPQAPRAQGQASGAELALFESANRERIAIHVHPLRWDSSLARAAHDHAVRLARANQLSHQLPGEEDLTQRLVRSGARFSAAAENIAIGPSAAGLHAQWMNSPPHRANLLDPELDSIGVAVVSANGEFFAVQDFSHTVADLSLDEQERELAALLKARGLRVLAGDGGASAPGGSKMSAEARWTCSLDSGTAGSSRPSFTLRYTTADLESLPAPLEQRIKSGRYHAAAIGACEPVGHEDFSNYRLVVMLFE